MTGAAQTKPSRKRTRIGELRPTFLGRFLCAGLALGLSACGNIQYHQQLAAAPAAMPSAHGVAAPSTARTLVIFFDGTANDFSSDTNIKRLHSLVTLQDRLDLATLYIEGVGTGNDLPGSTTGAGIGARVRLGYEFLLTHYRAGDRIVLFGFSRGAYQARILAGMLNHVGLPDAPLSQDVRRALLQQSRPALPETSELVRVIYEEMKAGFHQPSPLPAVTIDRVRAPSPFVFRSRSVQLLGLWDTVEALGKPNWWSRIKHKLGIDSYPVVIDEPNDRYGDQLLNVEHAVQALSLDDDREWIFTPLLISRCHLLQDKPLQGVSTPSTFRAAAAPPGARCDKALTAGHTVEEVWFPGAHSDVGGGYADSALSGVSLNWMIGRVKAHAPQLLVPTDPTEARPLVPAVRADPYGTSHDPEAGWWSLLYHRVNRNLGAYALLDGVGREPDTHRVPLNEARNSLCLHPSIIQRRQAAAPRGHENHYMTLQRPDATVRLCTIADERATPPIYHQVWEGPGEPPRGTVLASACQQTPRVVQLNYWSDQNPSGTCHIRGVQP